MYNEVIDSLLERLNQKIDKLKSYYELTERIISAEIEDINKLISARQEIIEKVDAINMSIKKIINAKNHDDSKILKNIIGYKITVAPEGYEKLFNKCNELKNLLVKISKAEEDATEHLNKAKNDLISEMKKSNNAKKVINYYSNIVVDKTNGNRFNASK